MADFYDTIAAKSASLHARYAQGTVTLSREEVIGPGPNPWDPPVTAPVVYELDAIVQGVAGRYVDQTLVIASDLQVQFSPLAKWILTDGAPASGETVTIAPVMTDTITVDGAAKVPKRILPIPASGDAAAFIVFVAG